MNSLLRNALAVVAGLVATYCVNMAVIMSSGFVVAPPQGADMMTAEGIRAAMPRMNALHFLMPLLAHALGTLAGGFAAAVTAVSHKMKMALVVGVIFLILGMMMVRLVGGPLWFIVLDLVVAFVPMAWLGAKLGIGMTGRSGPARAAALSH
jgi:vacuolar-type H+-ATPase subunit I/STV1